MAKLALQFGVPTKVVSGATATGVGASTQFGVPSMPGRLSKMLIQLVKTAGTLTTLTVDVEVSSDGETTFAALKSAKAIDLATDNAQIVDCVQGAIHQIDVKTITGAGQTDDIYVTAI